MKTHCACVCVCLHVQDRIHELEQTVARVTQQEHETSQKLSVSALEVRDLHATVSQLKLAAGTQSEHVQQLAEMQKLRADMEAQLTQSTNQLQASHGKFESVQQLLAASQVHFSRITRHIGNGCQVM